MFFTNSAYLGQSLSNDEMKTFLLHTFKVSFKLSKYLSSEERENIFQ